MSSPSPRAPFDPALVARRLREQLPQLRHVGGAADYAAIQALSGFPAPAAYVTLIAEDDADPSAPAARPMQAARVSLGVVLAVRSHRLGAAHDAHAAASDELRLLLGASRDALMGWQPPAPTASALRWTAGQMLDWDSATVLWADTYTLTHVLRSP